MAKGEKKSFGHHLFCLFGVTTKAMNDPRLGFSILSLAGGFEFATKHQQLIEGSDTMNDHWLLHFLGNGYLGTKGCHLHFHLQGVWLAMHFIQTTLTYCPHVVSACHLSNGCNRFLPCFRHVPRV